MWNTLNMVAIGCAIFFILGALTGAVRAEEPSLEMAPQIENDLAVPAEPLPSNPDEDEAFWYNLIEPSETLTEVVVVYAV
ncbi:MAG: hypothetical protein AAGA36_15940 [Pseudomonadota bacterium]